MATVHFSVITHVLWVAFVNGWSMVVIADWRVMFIEGGVVHVGWWVVLLG
jgi:hypothetical protein